MSNNTIGYIADGMEVNGYIAHVTGLHVALRFKYRPTLVRTRAYVSEQMRNATPQRAEELAAAHVSKQLAEWDLTAPGPDGKHQHSPGPTVDNLLKLQPTLSVKLFSIVMGTGANDVDPDDSESSRSSDADLERQLNDLAPDDDGQTERVKNSGTAST